jgi:hypothetical protein
MTTSGWGREAVPDGCRGGRSHSHASVGWIVVSTTASSSPVKVFRSISSRRQTLKAAMVWAAS